MSLDMIPDPMLDQIIEDAEHEQLERKLAEATAIIEDYFQNDREGWQRGWRAWRDRAAAFIKLDARNEDLEDDRGKHRS